MDQSKNIEIETFEPEEDTAFYHPHGPNGEIVGDAVVPPITDVVILTALDIKEDLNNVGEDIKKLGYDIKDTLNHAGEEIEKFGYNVEDTLNQAGENIITIDCNVKDSLWDANSNICEEIKKIGSTVNDEINKTIKNTLAISATDSVMKIKEKLDQGIENGEMVIDLKKDIDKFSTNMRGAVKKIGLLVEDASNHTVEEIEKFGHNLEGGASYVVEEMEYTFNATKKKLEHLGQDIEDECNNIGETLFQFDSKNVEEFFNLFEENKDMKEELSHAGKDIKKLGYDLKKTFNHAGEDILKTGHKVEEGIWDTYGNVCGEIKKIGYNAKEEIIKSLSDTILPSLMEAVVKIQEEFHYAIDEKEKFADSLGYFCFEKRLDNLSQNIDETLEKVELVVEAAFNCTIENIENFSYDLECTISSVVKDIVKEIECTVYSANQQLEKLDQDLKDSFARDNEESVKTNETAEDSANKWNAFLEGNWSRKEYMGFLSTCGGVFAILIIQAIISSVLAFNNLTRND